MTDPKQTYYDKRGMRLVANLQKRHFDACYCKTKEEALEKALSWIPSGALVGWGGAMSAQQIGLMDAVQKGDYIALDRASCKTAEQREEISRKCLQCDVFFTGANGISLDGQMVNVDGGGNRVAAICYGPKTILVVAGMNKVVDTLEEAVRRARTVAAPANQQRFGFNNPCSETGTCTDCKSETCICNQIVITRHCRPAGRIKFILVGEDMGL